MIRPVLALALAFALTMTIESGRCLADEDAKKQMTLSRGKKWLRANPFWIGALTQNDDIFDVNDYKGAGMTHLLAWDPKPNMLRQSSDDGLPIHYHLHQNHGETPEQYVEHTRALMEQYPGITGVMFWDEPRIYVMPRVRDTLIALRKAFPDKLIYSNALPRGARWPAKYGFDNDNHPPDFYDTYIERFGQIVEPDVVMIDIYPLGKGGGKSGIYFENMALVRREGMKLNAPYWVFIQSFDHDGRRRRPSDSDIRFQMFAPMAMGYTGFAYFTYDPALGPGLVDGAARRTPLYYHSGRANMEVANLGQALRFLDNTGVAFVLGRQERDGKGVPNPAPRMPKGKWTWPDVEGRSALLTDVTIDAVGPDRDAMLGFFRDDDGHEYLMVTNIWHDEGMTGADCAQTFTLRFDPKVTSLTRLSRETGRPEALVVEGGVLKLRLPGGTGDLFKLGDAPFPGLDEQSTDR